MRALGVADEGRGGYCGSRDGRKKVYRHLLKMGVLPRPNEFSLYQPLHRWTISMPMQENLAKHIDSIE